MEELNYPIKYAILGIEEQVGWVPGLHELEREYDVCGYIVSKVYLVSEQIKYNSDGSFEKSYQVVFPFSSTTEKMRKVPEYNLNWQCYNYVNVSQIFENFEEAKVISDEKNRSLRVKSYLPVSCGEKMSWKERILKGQEEFDERLLRYREFEQFILKETEDMIITINEKENVKKKVIKI